MIDVLRNNKHKILMLTYPKGASTSLRRILLPPYHQSPSPDLNQFGEEWLLDPSLLPNQLFPILEKYKDYTIYAFCREPVDRWSSTLLFLMQTKWDLFYSEISDTGQQIANNIDADYLIKLVSTLISINNNSCHFNDVHMRRPLFTLLQIKALYGDNVHLMQLDQMEKVVCDIHGVEAQTFQKANGAITGYELGHGYTSNQTHIPTLSSKWQSIVPHAIRNEEALKPVKNYLSVDNEIYKRVVLDDENANDVLLNILTGPRHDGSKWVKWIGPHFIKTDSGIGDFKEPLEHFLELIPQEGDLYNAGRKSIADFTKLTIGMK